MPSFYFEQLLQNGLNGIDQQGITTAVLQIAGVVLVLSLLWGVYEAYSNGGDVRVLGVAAVKYLVLGLVFVNYQSAFRAVNSMFNGVADGIYSMSGGVDVIKAWGNSLSQAWSSNPSWFSALWNMVTGGVSAIVAGLITLIGYLLLPFTYTLFTLFYALYGSILYVVGPFVLALMPSRALGQMGRSFFANMMIFQCWGLLYAILQSLMSALQITNPMQFSGSFLQAFVGSSQMIVMSVASVLISIMIALIPFIASRIVRGDIGSTLMTVISGAVTAGAVASGLALSAGEGLARGRMLAPEGPPPPPSAGPAGTSAGVRSTSQNSVVSGTAATAASGAPPSLNAGSASAAGAATSSTTGSSPAGLWNPDTGQVFSWNGSAWQDAGHVSAPDSGSTGMYGSTNWRGGNGTRSSRGYTGHSLAGFAARQAGHMAGRTMRWMGMGTES
jgi:hypothetical protein